MSALDTPLIENNPIPLHKGPFLDGDIILGKLVRHKFKTQYLHGDTPVAFTPLPSEIVVKLPKYQQDCIIYSVKRDSKVIRLVNTGENDKTFDFDSSCKKGSKVTDEISEQRRKGSISSELEYIENSIEYCKKIDNI